MAQKLAAYHREIMDGVNDMARHCALDAPDMASLGAARLRLTRASAARTRYISEMVIPALMQKGDKALKEELDAMLSALSTNRLASSDHVRTWTLQSIEADWAGYCAASKMIRTRMQDQIARERTLLIARLERFGL